MLSNCKCTVWSSAVRISFSRRDHRFRWSEGGSVGFSKIMDHDPICWMLWHHDGFFQTTAGVRSDRGHLIYLNRLRFYWSIRQILFTSVPLYYFDLKSDWLPCFPFAFGSSPEDLLFWYLLFVPIEYHGNFHFSRRNVPQIRTSDFVQSTDFHPAPPICRWQARGLVLWWMCWGGFPPCYPVRARTWKWPLTVHPGQGSFPFGLGFDHWITSLSAGSTGLFDFGWNPFRSIHVLQLTIAIGIYVKRKIGESPAGRCHYHIWYHLFLYHQDTIFSPDLQDGISYK